MRKIAIIPDIHIQAPTKYENNSGNLILSGSLQALTCVFEEGKKLGASAFIFTGDIHTLKDKIPNRVKNPLLRIFELSSKDIDIYIVTGNHDQNGEAIYYLNSYVNIINNVTNIALMNKDILLLPYFKDYSSLKKKEGFDLLVGHFTIKGSRVTNFIFDEGVDVERLQKMSKITLCGHVHKFQKVDTNVYHLGSIYQEDWGEAGEQKYFAMYDGGEVTFHKIPMFVNRVLVPFSKEKSLEYYKKSKTLEQHFKNSLGCAVLGRVLADDVDHDSMREFLDYLKTLGFAHLEVDTLKSDKTELEVKTEDNRSLESSYRDFLQKELDEINSVCFERYYYKESLNRILEGE